MFVLKSLGRLVLGNTEQKDLLVIEDGTFSSASIASKANDSKEVVFERAAMVLRRGPSPHSFYLLVRDQDGNEPDQLFPFDHPDSLKFTLLTTPLTSSSVLQWNSNELQFTFAVPQTASKTTVDMFHVTVAQCLYESASKKSHLTAKDEDIKKFLKTVEQSGAKDFDLSEHVVRFAAESAAGWYIFDADSGLFELKAERVRPLIVKGKETARDHRSTLVVADPNDTNKLLYKQLIDPDATHHTDRSSFSFVWCAIDESGTLRTFSLRFISAAAVMAFSNAIGQAIYEALNDAPMDPKDEKYLLGPFAVEVEMTDAPPLTVSDDSDGSDESDDDREESRDTKEENETFKWDEKASISSLAVGYKHDRSIVAKGHSLGIFKHTEDDRLLPSVTLPTDFTPNRMMLHQEDSNLLLTDQANPSLIYKMDLTVGKVVEEWGVKDSEKGGDYFKINNILPSSKYAQMTNEATLIGLNDNSLFRLDPRLPGPDKRVDSETKSYVVKNRFSCGATTGKGELAVASAKGDIRLFNKLDKRAKTLLPGFGDAILGIDVTENGQWIVATCKTYLLLINTVIDGSSGGDGTSTLGFSKSMPDKPTPIRLSLKPEHVAYMSTPVSFTPARFSTGSSEQRSIITSTGPFVVSWNFRRVKQGRLFDYQLKRYADTVVADDFRFGQDRAMIVALPQHVTMMTKKSLSCPTARSLRGEGEVDVVEKFKS
jgi:hypothetical protein